MVSSECSKKVEGIALYQDPFESLFNKRLSYIRYDLKNVQKAYKKLGLESRIAPSFLIGGTNGKGSTSGFLAKLFASSGSKVGLFTSPHLRSFRERIQCSHIPVTDELLLESLEKLKEALGLEVYESLSFFEVSILLALSVFSEQKTDINVIEVGLGGRLDATNIINLVASAIVSVSFDHTAILGETLQEILLEKLGISRESKPLFLGISQDKLVELKLNEIVQSEQRKKSFNLYQKNQVFSLVKRETVLHFPEAQEKSFPLPEEVLSFSPILQENYSLAFSIWYWFQRKSFRAFSYDQFYKNYAQSDFSPSSLEARFQSFTITLSCGQRQKVIVDVCHNEASLRECYRTLCSQGIMQKHGKIPVFLSILNDKPFNSMISYVQRFSDPLVLFSCSNERTLSRSSLGQKHQNLPFYDGFYAVLESFHVSHKTESPWLICGSFFAVGEVLQIIKKTET